MQNEENHKYKGIFLTLNELGITYSVVVSRSSLSFGDYSYSEYFIVVDKVHLPKLRKYKFKDNENHIRVVERNLTVGEQEIFRQMVRSHLFNEVVNNESGRVYELKNDSLKDKLKVRRNGRK